MPRKRESLKARHQQAVRTITAQRKRIKQLEAMVDEQTYALADFVGGLAKAGYHLVSFAIRSYNADVGRFGKCDNQILVAMCWWQMRRGLIYKDETGKYYEWAYEYKDDDMAQAAARGESTFADLVITKGAGGTTGGE